MRQTDVLVVGGGPAGLAAGLAARSLGARVAIVDEYPELGGQYYRRPFTGDVSGRSREGAAVVEQTRAAGIELLPDTLVWGISDGGAFEVISGGQRRRISSASAVLATGAYDTVIPFRGWTLPGVFTAGGGQTLIKWQQQRPGARCLVAGSGPFLLPVADELTRSGVRVAAVVEATRRADWLRAARHGWGHWARGAEAVSYLTRLARARVPMLHGSRVVEARGKGKVEEVVVEAINRDWTPIPGSTRVLQADALLVGYGFTPSTHLSRLLGCKHTHRREDGGWHVEHNADLETSISGIFVAGEAAGVRGAHHARASGRLAGLRAATAAGYSPAPEFEVAATRREMRRHRAFADVINRLFAVPPAAFQSIPDDVIVCRCEDVEAGEIRRCIAPWSGDPNSLRGLTRSGMGLCQARTCGPLLDGLITSRLPTHRLSGTVRPLTVRVPLKPIPLSAFNSAPLDDD